MIIGMRSWFAGMSLLAGERIIDVFRPNRRRVPGDTLVQGIYVMLER
jgi:hypothetical protein